MQTAWKFAQMGLLLLPLLPTLGTLSLFVALVITWRRQYQKIIRRPLNWGLAILAIWLIITASMGFDRLAAFLGLFNFLPFFALFAAFSELIQTPAQLRRLALILVTNSVLVILIGLGQVFLGWASSPKWTGILGWAIAPGGNPPGRMASVFMYTNVLACYLVIAFVLGLGLWMTTFGEVKVLRAAKVNKLNPVTPAAASINSPRLRDVRRMERRLLFTRCFLGIAVISNLIALILTNSRNAWAIAVVTSLAYAVYLGWRWLAIGVVAIASSVLLAAFGPALWQLWLRQLVPAFFWARLTDQLYPDRPVALLRKTQWQFAWNLTQQRPWYGWGLRNFTPLYQAQMQVWLGHPHNLWLMLTAETGIPGAVLFCGWVIWILVQGFLRLRDWVTCEQHLAREQLLFF